uniref:hypothetical protein n=1 Tax=Gracilaria urvillei TaxID=172974 RepID=UPI001D11C417|nr:hypothetical protein LK147_pgp115 [Hydropuntia urvillei]UAD88425.1 hypothetical protein [Hydropuntia urvillei]
MNLLKSFLLDRYIYSPKSWLHKVKSYKKTYLLFMYLCIISYLHFKYIAISAFLNVIIILHLKNAQNIYKKFMLQTLLIFLLILFIIMYNKILLIQLQFNKYYYILYIYNKYILNIRAFLIVIHYLLAIRILFLTTTYEDIIFCFFNLFTSYENYTIKKVAFISTFALQTLEGIIAKMKHILITIKIKKITKLFKFKYYIYIYFVSKFIQDIYKDIYRISSVMYTRELNDRLIYISNFDFNIM